MLSSEFNCYFKASSNRHWLGKFFTLHDILFLVDCIISPAWLWKVFHKVAAPLGLEVNWHRLHERWTSCSLVVSGHDVQRVDEFVYLGSLIHSTKRVLQWWTRDLKAGAMIRTTMQNLGDHITTRTKLRLYNVYIHVPHALHFTSGACGSQQINIHWHDFVRNVDVHCLTEQSPLVPTIRSQRLAIWARSSYGWEQMPIEYSLSHTRTLQNTPRSTAHYLAQEYLWWSCLLRHGAAEAWRQEMQHRIDSGGCWLCIALPTNSGACWYWIWFTKHVGLQLSWQLQ